MKCLRYVFVFLAVLTAVDTWAQGTACQKAVKEGFREVREFGEVLFPLFQKALPKKDYETLISSGMSLKRAAWTYSKMKYETHNSVKDSTYKAHRDSLSRLSMAYGDAAERYDTNAVCALLPQIEEQFEATAAAIVAYPWAEFDKLYETVEPFYDAEVAARGMDAPQPKEARKKTSTDISKTLDLISNRMAAWVASPIPAEIQYRATLIGEEQAYYTKLVEEMKATSAKGDLAKFRVHLTDLKVRLRNFTRSYLQ